MCVKSAIKANNRMPDELGIVLSVIGLFFVAAGQMLGGGRE